MLLGTVKIYSVYDELLETRQYYSKDGLVLIVDIWMNEYSGTGAYIQIAPYEYKKRDHEEKKHLLRIVPVPDKEIVGRPPAVYSNLPVYDYKEKKNGIE